MVSASDANLQVPKRKEAVLNITGLLGPACLGRRRESGGEHQEFPITLLTVEFHERRDLMVRFAAESQCLATLGLNISHMNE